MGRNLKLIDPITKEAGTVHGVESYHFENGLLSAVHESGQYITLRTQPDVLIEWEGENMTHERMATPSNTIAAVARHGVYMRSHLDAEEYLQAAEHPVCEQCGEDYVVVRGDSVGLCIPCAEWTLKEGEA